MGLCVTKQLCPLSSELTSVGHLTRKAVCMPVSPVRPLEPVRPVNPVRPLEPVSPELPAGQGRVVDMAIGCCVAHNDEGSIEQSQQHAI